MMIALRNALFMALVILTASGAIAEDKMIARFSALAVSMGSTATGARATIQVGISRWSSDAERDALFATLMEKGQDELSSALHETEEVGFVKTSSSLGYSLRFAREVRQNGKRRIILATERPISLREVRSNTRSKDYDITIIQLDLDEDGNGEGAMAAGVTLKVDKETNELTIENYSSEPIRLMQVRTVR